VESTHTVIESVRERIITPDDAMRILIPYYAPGMDFVPTLESVIDYMRDHKNETGDYPPEFIDFGLCNDCSRLIVWDDVSEDFRHLVHHPSCWLESRFEPVQA
jgi:hypothetical protein